MKSTKILLVFFTIFIATAIPASTRAQVAEVNLSVFQQELSPYGRWVFNPNYGQVWIYGDPAFRPYATNGHWDYTNYGWSWVSDFDWGWAPFHYGRWEYDAALGWMWIPGYEWASAWVSWSQCDGYYGWAPLGYGLGVNISFGSIPYNRWNFIPRQYMGRPDFYRYCAAPRNNYFRNALMINNFYNGREGRFFRGPDRNEVERYTNNPIEERQIGYRDRLVMRNNTYGNNRGNIYNSNREQNNNRNSNSNEFSRPGNNNYGQGRAFENRPQRYNQSENNNRNENGFPVRPQNNFPDIRQNQVRNNNYPDRRDNNFERPRQQVWQTAPFVQQQRNRPGNDQQFPQRNMERRQQAPQQPQGTEWRPNGNFQGSRGNNEPHHPSPVHEGGGRRQGRN